MNIVATIGLYLICFILLLIAIGIIFSVISFLIRLFQAEEQAVKETKRAMWLIACSVFGFCLFFVGIIFKLNDKQKRNEEYLNRQQYQTQFNQERNYINKGNNYLSCNKSKPTGLCQDGTETCAVNRQGACSHHGGLKIWY